MKKIAEFWARVQQGNLLPELQERLGTLSEKHQKLVLVLEFVRIEEHVFPAHLQWIGRKRKDRKALARAFVAKSCYNEPTTVSFLDRLEADKKLRRLCGWEYAYQIPSESTFSRAFAEFAGTALSDRVHEALVKLYFGDDLIWHVSRDSTAIVAREAAAKKPPKEVKAKRKPGRPRRDEVRPAPQPTRMQRQYEQSYPEAISQLPKACDVGSKLDSKGNTMHWVGYKFHVDVCDGDIPLSAVTTSASVHDSQVAIPLARMTADRVTSLYDLMDGAYDAKLIHQVSYDLGHVPIIAINKRCHHKTAEFEPDRARRYCNRTSSERFNSRLKDCCGGRNVRVRGHTKVHAHLMFGLLVIFAEAVLGLLD